MAVDAASADRALPHPAATTCCIVGGGPAGVLLTLLLGRRGVRTTLLEAHEDFDRDFRGDTVHPPTLELLETLGLVERALALPHEKIEELTPPGAAKGLRLSALGGRYPFVAMMPQAPLLDLLAREADALPCVDVLLGASFQKLLVEDERVVGVRYRRGDEEHELRATLTVGADGRGSRVRREAGLVADRSAQPIDVLWFRVPRLPEETGGAMGRVHDGNVLVFLPRGDEWQIAYLFPKGDFGGLRERGLDAFKRSLIAAEPTLEDRLDHLASWSDLRLLKVEADRVRRWYREGLLVIGDAAHTMSPVGGVGINFAVQDAIAAANELTEPLLSEDVAVSALARVQRERQLPTRVIQWLQRAMLGVLLRRARSGRPFRPPFFLRWPLVARVPLRLFLYGVRTTRLARRS